MLASSPAPAVRTPLSAVQNELSRSVYAPLRRIDVDHSDGQIVLRGQVRSYFLKQMAYVTASSVAGRPIVDEVQVS